MDRSADRYFLKRPSETEWQEVSLEEYCRAERAAGFYPKLAFTDSRYMTTPATASFHSSRAVFEGRIEYGR